MGMYCIGKLGKNDLLDIFFVVSKKKPSSYFSKYVYCVRLYVLSLLVFWIRMNDTHKIDYVYVMVNNVYDFF